MLPSSAVSAAQTGVPFGTRILDPRYSILTIVGRVSIVSHSHSHGCSTPCHQSVSLERAAPAARDGAPTWPIVGEDRKIKSPKDGDEKNMFYLVGGTRHV